MPSSLGEWITEVNNLMRMGNLIADDTGRVDAFMGTWVNWLMFISHMLPHCGPFVFIY